MFDFVIYILTSYL